MFYVHSRPGGFYYFATFSATEIAGMGFFYTSHITGFARNGDAWISLKAEWVI